MQLSYSGRLVCLALCSAGLLQVLLEMLAWLAAPGVLRRMGGGDARPGERSLFLLALFARLGPWLVVLSAWVPAYLRGEDNLKGEHVGWVCLAGAVGVLGLTLFCSFRAVWAWSKALRCCGLCREAGLTAEGVPVLLYPGRPPLLAVVGVFRSRILLAQSLLASQRFSREMLETALLHEGAHAKQRDNLKLLVLSVLPHVPFHTRRRASLTQHWRLAAEMAADEDGTRNRPERSVLLAELLVAMARESTMDVPYGLFALLSREEDLRVRVERLLEPRVATPRYQGREAPHAKAHTLGKIAVSLAALGMLCWLFTSLGHRAAELLLHFA